MVIWKRNAQNGSGNRNRAKKDRKRGGDGRKKNGKINKSKRNRPPVPSQSTKSVQFFFKKKLKPILFLTPFHPIPNSSPSHYFHRLPNPPLPLFFSPPSPKAESGISFAFEPGVGGYWGKKWEMGAWNPPPFLREREKKWEGRVMSFGSWEKRKWTWK